MNGRGTPNMSQIHKIVLLASFSIFLAACLPFCAFGQLQKYQGNAEAKALTQGLPPIDKVELLKLEKKGDSWTGKIQATKVLTGYRAQKFATLWRQQKYVPMSAICHLPTYAVKFYTEGKLLTYATLCWDCDNIGFEEPKLDNTQGFDGKGEKGRKLLQAFKDAFVIK